jgi:phospholipid/cholesterol/gamma-HCH transport system ATP-binding protein
VIVFKDIHKAFAGKPVLSGMSLEIREGEVMFIIGTSGVGKSVTIKLLVGLLALDKGEIWLDDLRLDTLGEREMFPVRKRVGMVFQNAGMRKRAAIARTLTVDPEVVLFDEPTTGLDPVSARRIDRLIRTLSDEVGVTSIVVSHDLTSIFSIADRIAFLYRGVVHLVGTPAEFRSSPDPVVQQFIAGRSSGEMETPGF